MFLSYLANVSRLPVAEATSCGERVTDCEVRDALKQVGLNRSSVLDDVPYKMFFRLLHMFVPILMDFFSHWFTLGAILDRFTKGVITLLKKGGRYVRKNLDD